MSYPAFSLSIHLWRRISSRSAKNSLYKTEFLTSSEASSFGGSIRFGDPQSVDNSLQKSNQNHSFVRTPNKFSSPSPRLRAAGPQWNGRSRMRYSWDLREPR